MAYRVRLSLGLAGLALSAAAGVARSDSPISLALPLDCRIGQTCFIQQYPDQDPGPGAKDYACGSRTYDGHDGIDIRVPSKAARLAGVPVLAAAAGTVKGARDGMADADPRTLASGAIKDKECGNGAVITHADGWETQYCHMEQGSVRVRPGQTVKAGDQLGLVGQSGQAEFPHLHLTVRKDGKWVNPLAYGAAPGQCRGGRSLFTPAATQALSYKSPDVLNIGFTDAPPTAAGVEDGLPAVVSFTPDAAALVFYVRLIGLEAGDVQHVVLIGPDGKIMAESKIPPLDQSKAQYFAFAGKKRTAPWAAGTYAGKVEVIRAGKPVLSRDAQLVVR